MLHQLPLPETVVVWFSLSNANEPGLLGNNAVYTRGVFTDGYTHTWKQHYNGRLSALFRSIVFRRSQSPSQVSIWQSGTITKAGRCNRFKPSERMAADRVCFFCSGAKGCNAALLTVILSHWYEPGCLVSCSCVRAVLKYLFILVTAEISLFYEVIIALTYIYSQMFLEYIEHWVYILLHSFFWL